MNNLTDARESVDRIRVDLVCCDGLISELEKALSAAEAHFPQEAPETVLAASS